MTLYKFGQVNETWERECCVIYCGYRAAFGGYNSILAVYFHDRLGHSQNMSNLVVTSFISTTFVFSLLGGVLSDCYFGIAFFLFLFLSFYLFFFNVRFLTAIDSLFVFMHEWLF